MQRDCSLAGSWATLNDEHTPEVGADDPVLFRLDRGDDVVHAPGALRGERGEQCPFALQFGAALGQEIGVEDVVLDAHDIAALRDQVAACSGAHRVERRGLVKGAGLRHPPIEQDRRLVSIAQADSADITSLQRFRCGCVAG